MIKIFKVFTEVAYWRKFNALHGWFVKNCQNGVDDCGYYEVTKEHLEKLLLVLEYVEQNKDPDPLRPVGGFFFGSTEICDWYWEDVKIQFQRLRRFWKPPISRKICLLITLRGDCIFSVMTINLSDFTKFVVIGFYAFSTKKFRNEYSSENGHMAFMINLWRGNVYGYRKSDGKRIKLKSVYN